MKFYSIPNHVHVTEALVSFPDKVCGQYRDGDVVGDQCESFCGPEPFLKIDSCQTWHGGKELVFSATLGPRKVTVCWLLIEMRLEEHPGPNDRALFYA